MDIKDETEVSKLVVVNQRSYAVPQDVADHLAFLHRRLKQLEEVESYCIKCLMRDKQLAIAEQDFELAAELRDKMGACVDKRIDHQFKKEG